ncbi:MAG: GNAT family N-acetyltransferase [Anaerolineales bacterium]|nr:GNAT family N-acetyltransferase [Anaerolineales bacterium]
MAIKPNTIQNNNIQYQQRVEQVFSSVKSCATYAEAFKQSISLPNDAGYLLPVCEVHATDDILITKLAKWRDENSFAYPTRFPVTFDGTKKWLRAHLLDVKDRILFLVLDRRGNALGHVGLANAINETAEVEIDNILRGEKQSEPGILSLAMQALLKWTQETLRPKRIFLHVFNDNQHAIAFYHRLGFSDEKLLPLKRIESGDNVNYVSDDGQNQPADSYFLQMTYPVLISSESPLKLISIVIPARNEELNIAPLEEQVLAATENLPYDFEFIVIDNRSTDRTGELVKEICNRDARWKYIRFSRDFTSESSITAGYHYASGDAIIVLYSDLQDPPAMLPRFLEKWEQGYEVVYGVRTIRRGDPAWRNFLTKLFYRLINSLADINIPVDTGDFRLIDKKVRNALESIGEYNRYMRGLIAWIGFKQTGVVYERQPRTAGVSKGPFWHILLYALTAITSFSIQPLRFFLIAGVGITVLSLVAVVINLLLYFIGKPVAGLTTIFILSFLGIGINSFGIGLLGEYLGRTYFESKRRPIYIVDEMVGF